MQDASLISLPLAQFVSPWTAVFTTVLGLLALIPYIYMRCKGASPKALLLKTTVSVFFLLTCTGASLAGSNSLFLCAGIMMGLVFGLLGDIYLDQKDMYPAHHDTYVFTGFTVFLIGHLFYSAGLLTAYKPALQWIGLAAGLSLLVSVATAFAEKPLKMNFGKFKTITIVYGFFLSMTMNLAFVVYFTCGKPRQALVMALGALAFWLSDLVLSGTYFGEGKNRPVDIISNYVLYYGAQFAIALSLVF